jgi:3D (Asp-Asp-Asp) domain-containing protein
MVSDTTWRTTPSPRSDAYNIVTAANPGTLEPVAFKTAVFPLVTSLAIQGTDTLAITDDTAIAGQATISLVYL